MKILRPITALAVSTAIAATPVSSALAQRPQPSPEQRIDRLERQVNEMQRRVYPKGKPADTAGFSDDPAATQSSVLSLNQRLDALQRQMADMLRQAEENGNRLRTLEAGIGQLRTDEDQRIQVLEQRMNEAAAAAAAAPVATEPAPATTTTTPPPKAKPKPSTSPKTSGTSATTTADSDTPAAEPASDPGEDAYSEGFHLWEAGNYDQAISTLKSFVSAYPKHKRVSYANNLIGRALLDKGDARAAATALLSNYRNDPGGARAPDSLFYLGQALMKLGQPGQACKAYSELDAVYGAKVRPDLKKLEDGAKTEANCG